jgi:hypothetical protein
MEKSKNKVLGIIAAAALVLVCVAAGTYPSWKPVSTVSGEFTGQQRVWAETLQLLLQLKIMSLLT